MTIRLSKKDLSELIEATEAAGNDTIELRGLLDQVNEDARLKQSTKSRYSLPSTLREEERLHKGNKELYRYTLGLFVHGDVTEEMLESIAEYDAKYSVSQLQKMLEECQLSTVGIKVVLCARLVAKGKEG